MAHELVSNVYLFKALSPDQVAWIARLAGTQRQAAGSVIFRQGDKAHSMYIIRYGFVSIKHQRKDGEEIEVAVLGSGSHFGEMSLLTSENRTVGAIASENCELFLISYDRLKRLLEDQPLIGARVYKSLAQMLGGRLSATMEDLTFVREKF